MRKWIEIAILLVLAVTLTACNLKDAGVETYTYDTRNFIEAAGDVAPSATIANIEVDWVAGSVRVVAGNVSGVTARETGVGDANNVHLCYRVSGDTLTIAFAKSGTQVRNISKSLVITVPADALPEQVKINAVAATINVEANVTERLQVSSVSGRVECGLDGTDHVDIDSVSGSINLRLKDGRNINLQSVSGAVNMVAQTMFEELEIESVSGAVNLTMPASADFSLRFDTVSGKINTGDFACTRSGGNRYTCGVGGAEIEIDTTSAGVTLKSA